MLQSSIEMNWKFIKYGICFFARACAFAEIWISRFEQNRKNVMWIGNVFSNPKVFWNFQDAFKYCVGFLVYGFMNQPDDKNLKQKVVNYWCSYRIHFVGKMRRRSFRGEVCLFCEHQFSFSSRLKFQIDSLTIITVTKNS